jgi:predicted peptidase
MRNTRLLIVTLAILLAACQSAPEAVKYQTGVHLQAQFDIPDLVEGSPPSHDVMNYLIYLPEGYGEDPEQLWPMIFFLHGSGSETNDSAYVMSYGLPEVLHNNDQPEDFPFVVVSPQLFPGTTWWANDHLSILHALIDEVSKQYQINTSRIFLTGLSMGGFGSWHLASAYPDKFAAVISLSGSGFGNRLPQPDELCRVAETPLWGIHGEKDLISDPLSAKLMVISLEAECDPVEVKWTLYPDSGHFETYEQAYRDPELYEWLLEHSLEQ